MSDMNSNYFQANPVKLDISRSRFPLSHSWEGTFMTGKLIPTLVYPDILPGDTFKVSAKEILRSVTPIAPCLDDAFLDVEFFFVPHKLVLSRQYMSPSVNDSNRSWEAFIGAQDSLLNMPLPKDVELPMMDIFNSSGSVDVGSFADYCGLPLSVNGSYGGQVNCLGYLAYCSVWNEFYRDPNLDSPITFSINSSNKVEVDLVSDIGSADSIFHVCRFHGYFGSALPWPQRNSTTISLGLTGDIPLYGDLRGGLLTSSNPDAHALALDGVDHTVFLATDKANSPLGFFGPLSGLYAKASDVSLVSINQLRLSIQTQRWFEELARCGNRLSEMTTGLFGVTPHDYGDDRPEYLGGKRIPIRQIQVANTAGTNISTETQQSIGSTGAFSLTGDSDYFFTKSFDTWGTLLCVVCVRTEDLFCQGINKMYSRKSKFDFYFPQFANIGEQPILNKEIFVSNTGLDDEVFGYQEAWAEYRYFPSVVCGLLRPGQNLSYWSYCNNFGSTPTLKGFLNAESEASNIDQNLQVQSKASGFQWLMKMEFNIEAIRPMPLYSIPGLMDHH